MWFSIPKPAAGQKTVSAGQSVPGWEDGGRQQREKTETNKLNPLGTSAIVTLMTAQDEIDALVDEALELGDIDLNVISQVIDDSQSYEELQQRIAEAYPALDMANFRNIMAKAIFLADIRGRTLT